MDSSKTGETLTRSEVRGFSPGQIAHNRFRAISNLSASFPDGDRQVQKFIMRDEVEQKLGLKRAKTA